MPRKKPNPRDVRLDILVSQIERDAIGEAAQQWDESVSDYVREAILQRLERERWISRDVTITKRFDLETGETTNKIKIDFSQATPPEEGSETP